MSTLTCRIVVCLTLLGLFSCAGYADRPGTVDARSYYYRDDNGLSVSTTGVALEQPVSARASVIAQALVDHVRLEKNGKTHVDDAGQATGHQHDGMDAVSGASISTTRGLLERETRYEGTLGAAYYIDAPRGPASVQGAARVSVEPDYRSLAGRARASWELSQSGTTFAALGGYGHDVSDPNTPPPGESSDWPASSDRFHVGLTLTQVLSQRLVASAGSVVSHQYGTLESPYRRAQVSTSLFPERLPGSRTRSTSFVSLSLYLGANMALHGRSGGYVDSWGVLAAAPEAAYSLQLTNRDLVTLRYRFYQQTQARFYETSYSSLEGSRTGDARLGRIQEHELAAEVSLLLFGRRGERGVVSLVLGYGFLLLDHLDLARQTRAHVASAGISGVH